MKVRFQMREGKITRAHTGKGKFVQRLYREFDKIGIQWTEDKNEPVDIDVCINKPLYMPENAKRRIMRLGPVEYDTKRQGLEEQWKIAKKYRKRCHGIIYQSHFARKMNDAFLGRPKHDPHETVIFNGADPEYYANIKPMKSEYRSNFVLSTREYVWEKRLKDVIEAYLMNHPLNSCLWIAGQVWGPEKRFPPEQKHFEKRYDMPYVRFLGPCEDRQIASLLRMANTFLHCVHVDACPNALIEAMCAGCRVIYTPRGGQADVLQDYTPKFLVTGDEESPPAKPYNRRKQPPIDKQKLNKIMHFCTIPDWEFVPYYDRLRSVEEARHVHIGTIAKQYADFFEKVLS